MDEKLSIPIAQAVHDDISWKYIEIRYTILTLMLVAQEVLNGSGMEKGITIQLLWFDVIRMSRSRSKISLHFR